MALQDSDENDSLQAIAYLREAVRLAPDYGEAWGALALAYSIAIEVYEPSDRIDEFKLRFEEAARQTDRYNPGNLDAQFARAIRENVFGRWTKLERVYREFARRNPNYIGGHSRLAWLLMNVGRWGEAVDALRRAKAINPNLPGKRYGLILSLWSAGMLTEAENEIEESIRRWPRHPFIWEYKVKILGLTGRPLAALGMVNDDANRPDDDGFEVKLWRAYLTALISRSKTDVEVAMKMILDSASRSDFPPLPQAFQLAVLGQSSAALNILEGCFLGVGAWASKKPNPPGRGLVTHPLFQPQAKSLWGSPRFNQILNNVGLERYWRDAGVKPDYRRAA